ncbi:MAG: cell division protein FtsQ/DivIB [Hyphomicrobiaceae bacterium]
MFTERKGQFWWRATEPIPTRPEPLAPADPYTPPPVQHQPVPAPAPQAPRETAWFRPDADAHRAPVDGPLELSIAPERKRPNDHREVFEESSADDGWPEAPPVSATRKGAIRARKPVSARFKVTAAGVLGAAMFAILTGFGRDVRPVVPLSRQIDALLARSGLAINEVAVTGHVNTSESDVFRAIGTLNGSILTWDLEAAQHRIESLPWVKSAALTRIWPDKLKVAITEREPAAVWFDGAKRRLVDTTGRELGDVGGRATATLARIAGDGAPGALASLLRVLARHPEIAADVDMAIRKGRRRWDLAMKSGLLVRFAADRLDAGLARFAALRDRHADVLRAARTVDLRLPARIAIGPDAVPLPYPPRNTDQAATAAPLKGGRRG